MTSLAEKLVGLFVKHELRFDHIGLGPQGELKYFIGLNFSIDKQTEKRELW